jgi:diphosphomevalonate decarboxylase
MQATAIAHPNIALIKYWGKADVAANVPATPSLSITLDGVSTRTHVAFSDEFVTDAIVFNGVLQQQADRRMLACIDRLRARAGSKLRAHVETENDFPTAAGLASSASGFAALVTAVDAALGLGMPPAERALEARRASASAARSIFGGFVMLETRPGADAVQPLLAANEWPLAVVLAICAGGAKKVGSGTGMQLSAATSPLYRRWVETTRADFADAGSAIARRDFETLGALAESSCLKMHATMLSTIPPLIYWTGATVECMHAVRDLRRSGTGVFFTIDAGPQLKAVCVPEHSARVRDALTAVAGVQSVVDCRLGPGATVVTP